MNMNELVSRILDDDFEQDVSEASVYLPPRSSVWVGVFSGPVPGIQIRRSTGVRDKAKALEITRDWEAKAREERLALPKQSSPCDPPGGLSQKEIAFLLQMSERAVRNIEKRALAKLRQHPALREYWSEHTGLAVEQSEEGLTTKEMVALLGLAKSPFEPALLRRLFSDFLLL